MAPTLVDDGTLRVVGGSFDPARADSAVIAALVATGVDPETPHLVRHHLTLPDVAAVESARAVLAQEGYQVLVVDAAAPAPMVPGASAVRASRTQTLTALSLAQERSRMAGLAQRLGGSASGWDACAPQLAPPQERPR
jgi:hypothetical protein